MTVRVLTGDCREVLATLPEQHFDACITDPPYHLTSVVKRFGNTSLDADGTNEKRARDRSDAMARLSGGFMGQKWDGGDLAFTPELWRAVYRVLKPGAYLLAFGGTRTHHRMACAIEDAGFEIRDEIMWLYGSGFPKSHNGEWGGTALKPALEPITMARKPLEGTVEANWRKWGTGALNIDGCRVALPEDDALHDGIHHDGQSIDTGETDTKWGFKAVDRPPGLGRWPANLIHDGSEEVVAAFPETTATGKRSDESKARWNDAESPLPGQGKTNRKLTEYSGDSGSATRFFYAAKASKAERGAANNHPTVKPLTLMQYLCRLVTPKGGTVLDPFAGSGTTGLAADREGFNATLIEMDPAYAEIARNRINGDAPLFAEPQEARA